MATDLHREPWNKGIIVGQKAPLKLKEVWAIRMRLTLAHRARELALFNLGVDSKLRACDLVQLRVRDICHGDRVANRAIGVDSSAYGTHSIRRTKASLIYGRTKNLRAVQLLLGHTKLESTVRYLGIEVDDALEMAEQTEV
jgi:integrase